MQKSQLMKVFSLITYYNYLKTSLSLTLTDWNVILRVRHYQSISLQITKKIQNADKYVTHFSNIVKCSTFHAINVYKNDLTSKHIRTFAMKENDCCKFIKVKLTRSIKLSELSTS